MLYLLDANVLIDANRDYYPMDRVPEFWDWLLHQAVQGNLKVPLEVYEEVAVGNDQLAEWMRQASVREHLLLEEEVGIELVGQVTDVGYATDLTDEEVERMGRDPFLIAYALARPGVRTVVTTEGSKPSRVRANRHVPDVCNTFGVPSCSTFELTRRLNFRTNWRPSAQ